MPHSLHIGDHVLADFGVGYVVAHVAGIAYLNADGETKYPIQDPSGSSRGLAYRETADIDAAGSGLTFKKIPS